MWEAFLQKCYSSMLTIYCFKKGCKGHTTTAGPVHFCLNSPVVLLLFVTYLIFVRRIVVFLSLYKQMCYQISLLRYCFKCKIYQSFPINNKMQIQAETSVTAHNIFIVIRAHLKLLALSSALDQSNPDLSLHYFAV